MYVCMYTCNMYINYTKLIELIIYDTVIIETNSTNDFLTLFHTCTCLCVHCACEPDLEYSLIQIWSQLQSKVIQYY